MNIGGVADTHAVIWYLAPDNRLSAKAKTFIDEARAAGNQIALSSISLIELVYLIEKNKIPAESLSRLALSLRETPTFVEIPVSLDIARALARVEASQIPDMPDRIIAATALHLNVPVISRDSRIRLSSLQTIW